MIRCELYKRIGEVLGRLYWAQYHRKLRDSGSADYSGLFGLEDDPEQLKVELAGLRDRLRRKDFEEELNPRGNVVVRWSRGGVGRYHWDFGPCKARFGWQQYDTDQDASYFGVWVHLQRRLVLTYCEGDVTLVRCATDDQLRAELNHMETFYGPPPPAFWTSDSIGASDGRLIPEGNVTAYYDMRPRV